MLHLTTLVDSLDNVSGSVFIQGLFEFVMNFFAIFSVRLLGHSLTMKFTFGISRLVRVSLISFIIVMNLRGP